MPTVSANPFAASSESFMSLFCFPLSLIIDKNERYQNNRGPDPVQKAGVLMVDNDLTDKGHGNRHTESNSCYEGGGKEHCVGPGDVRDKGGYCVDLRIVRRWLIMRFFASGYLFSPTQ